MNLEGKEDAAENGAEDGAEGDSAETDDAKVIVRSNGTVTYVGKDIAYQTLEVRPAGPRFSISAILPLSKRPHVVGQRGR